MDENNKNSINLRCIKSPLIIKILFSFLYEKQKLEMIKYNKYLQKIFLVNIGNYKKLSGKYKIGEKDGNGKEYILYTNDLLFEGEYLNNRKNGKGKEYYKNNEIKYEGEYLKRKRKNDNGIIKFEGEYLNGKRNGKGKEYYLNGKLEFKGEYLNGKKWNGNGYNIKGDMDFDIKDGEGNIKEYYSNVI